MSVLLCDWPAAEQSGSGTGKGVREVFSRAGLHSDHPGPMARWESLLREQERGRERKRERAAYTPTQVCTHTPTQVCTHTHTHTHKLTR